MQCRILLVCFSVLLLCGTPLLADSLPASEESEYAEFEQAVLSGLGVEQESALLIESMYEDANNNLDYGDLPPFINPTGVIQVPLNTNFTILRNHTVAAGGTTGFWDLITNMGETPCTNFRNELSAGTISCTDSGLDFFGLQNVNIDPNYMTAQFLYTFRSGLRAAATSITICTFRPWESCPGNATTIKIQMLSEADYQQAVNVREQIQLQ